MTPAVRRRMRIRFLVEIPLVQRRFDNVISSPDTGPPDHDAVRAKVEPFLCTDDEADNIIEFLKARLDSLSWLTVDNYKINNLLWKMIFGKSFIESPTLRSLDIRAYSLDRKCMVRMGRAFEEYRLLDTLKLRLITVQKFCLPFFLTKLNYLKFLDLENTSMLPVDLFIFGKSTNSFSKIMQVKCRLNNGIFDSNHKPKFRPYLSSIASVVVKSSSFNESCMILNHHNPPQISTHKIDENLINYIGDLAASLDKIFLVDYR